MNMLKIEQVIRVTDEEVQKVMAEPGKWDLVISRVSVGCESGACHSSETRIPLTEFSGFSFGLITERGIVATHDYRSFQLFGKAGRRDYSFSEGFDPQTQEIAKFVEIGALNDIIITQPMAVEYVP